MATAAAADEADRSFRLSQARGERPPSEFRVPDYSGHHHRSPSSSRRYRLDWGEMDGSFFGRQPRPVMVEEPLHSSDVALLHSSRHRHKASSRLSLHQQSAMYSTRPHEPPLPSLTRSATAPHSQRKSYYEEDFSRSDSRRSSSRRGQSPRSHPFQSSIPGSPATSLTEPESDSDSSTSSRGHSQSREPCARPRDAVADRYQAKVRPRRQPNYDDVIIEEEDDRRSGYTASVSRRRTVPSVEQFIDRRDQFHAPQRSQRQQGTPEFEDELASSPDSRRRHHHSSQAHKSYTSRRTYVTDGSDTGSSLSRNIGEHRAPKHCGQRIKSEDVHHTLEGHKYGICSRCTERICYLCGTKWKRCDCPAMPRRGDHDHLAAEWEEHHTKAPSHQTKRSDIRDTEHYRQPSGIYSPPESPSYDKSIRSNFDTFDSPQSRDSRGYREREQLAPRLPLTHQDSDEMIRSMHEKQGEDLKRRLRGSPGREEMTARYLADEGPESMKSPQSTALTHSRLGPMVPVAASQPLQHQPDSECYALGTAYSNHPRTQTLPPPAVPIAPPPSDYHVAPALLSKQMASPPPTYAPVHYPHGYHSSAPPSHVEEQVYAHSYPPPYPPAPVPPHIQMSPRGPPEPQADTAHWQYDAPRARQREHSPAGSYARSLTHTASTVPPPVPMPPPAVPSAPSEPVRLSEMPGHVVRATQATRSAPSPPPEAERHSRAGDYVSSVNKARTRQSSQERRMADRFKPELRHSFGSGQHYALTSHGPLPVHQGPMLHGSAPSPSIISLHAATPMHHHVPSTSPAHHHSHTPPRSQHTPVYSYASPAISVAIPLHPGSSIPVMAHVPIGPMPHPAMPLIPGPPFGSMARRHTMDDEIFGSNNSRSTRSSDLGPTGGSGRRSRRNNRSGDKHGANGGDSHSPSSISSRRRQRQNIESSSIPTANRRHHQNEAPYLEDEEEKPSDSSLAGLSGSGRGMNRVYEWNKHVVMGSSPETPVRPPSSVIS